MSRRTYSQYCGLAVALDLLGERWTLLVLRNLLHGPQRYKDLLEGLPGIGTGILADRLRVLETAGVIRRATLPPPAGSAVYELTEQGQELREPILGLTRWGVRLLGDVEPDQAVRVDWLLVALEVRYQPQLVPDLTVAVVLAVEGQRFYVAIDAGRVTLRAAGGETAQATISTSMATLVDLNAGTLDMVRALDDGHVQVDGDVDAAIAFGTAFGLAVNPAGSAAGTRAS